MRAERASSAALGSSKMKHGRVIAARRGGRRVLERDGRLAAARRADQQVLVPRSTPPPSSVSSAATPLAISERSNVGRRARPRPAAGTRDAAATDREVVVAAAEVAAAQLDDLQLPARLAVRRRLLLERDHAVGDALQLQVRALGGAVVEQEHRAVAADEELLEREDLAPVAQRALRQQAHLGERVEHHPLRA